MTDPITRSLAQFLAEHVHAGVFYVAFSGGLDSTVLLHALCRLCSDSGQLKQIVAVHINHNLQSDSRMWADQCDSVCSKLGVRLLVHEIYLEAEAHVEERARKARYSYFKSLLQERDLLLMAHHRNDVAETLLFRLMRGSATAALTAIPALRNLGQGSLHRPLLRMDRKQLELYAAVNNLHWNEDPSNQDTRFDRNFLRARVLPLLLERWPGALKSLANTVEQLREDQAIIDSWLDEHLQRVKISNLALHLDRLAEYKEVQRGRLLRFWLEQHGWYHLSRKSLLEFTLQLGARRHANPVFDLPERTGGQLQKQLSQVHPFQMHLFQIQLRPYQEKLQLCCHYQGGLKPVYEWKSGVFGYIDRQTGTQICALPHGYLFAQVDASDVDKLAQLHIRFPLAGQKVSVSTNRGASSIHKALARLLQEAGVPPWQRSQFPLIYAGDTLLAVPGTGTGVGPGVGPGVGNEREIGVPCLWIAAASSAEYTGRQFCWYPAYPESAVDKATGI